MGDMDEPSSPSHRLSRIGEQTNGAASRNGSAASSRAAPKLAELCRLHAEAMAKYREASFEEAEYIFMKVHKLFSEALGRPDEPSRLLLGRCRKLTLWPSPPDDWD